MREIDIYREGKPKESTREREGERERTGEGSSERGDVVGYERCGEGKRGCLGARTRNSGVPTDRSVSALAWYGPSRTLQ